jgi:hypothetical protein
MLRRALILLTLLSVHAVAQPTSERTPMAQAVAAIKLKPNWQRIEITEEKPTSYRLQLYYKPLGQRHSPVVSRAEATADMKEIARAVLDELKKEGKTRPRTGSTSPYGRNKMPGRDDGEASHYALW